MATIKLSSRGIIRMKMPAIKATMGAIWVGDSVIIFTLSSRNYREKLSGLPQA
jgi:hypothetical protein